MGIAASGHSHYRLPELFARAGEGLIASTVSPDRGMSAQFRRVLRIAAQSMRNFAMVPISCAAGRSVRFAGGKRSLQPSTAAIRSTGPDRSRYETSTVSHVASIALVNISSSFSAQTAAHS
jgi:hypothetical protein